MWILLYVMVSEILEAFLNTLPINIYFAIKVINICTLSGKD